MNLTELKQMEKFERTYWWHIGKKQLVENFIKSFRLNKDVKILEIGCGAGEITEMLTSYGNVYANDIAKLSIDTCKKRGIKNTIEGDITKLDLGKYKGEFGVVLALDVLEHIQDDVGAVKRIYELLEDKGRLVVTVPAYKFLWSSHDEALQHQRRYTDFEIKTKLEDSGFEILKQSHFVFFAFPVIALVKFLGNFFSKIAYPESSYVLLPDRLNGLMVKVLRFEAFLMSFLRLPFGTTITVVAQKREI